MTEVELTEGLEPRRGLGQAQDGELGDLWQILSDNEHNAKRIDRRRGVCSLSVRLPATQVTQVTQVTQMTLGLVSAICSA